MITQVQNCNEDKKWIELCIAEMFCIRGGNGDDNDANPPPPPPDPDPPTGG
jgi:hypothetical protein